MWAKDENLFNYKNLMLDWLFEPKNIIEQLPVLNEKTNKTLQHNFSHIVLLGMGGSSLAPYVFNEIFPKKSNYPQFLVLDSIHPCEVSNIEKQIDLSTTLFIVSSKSGNTLEPLILYEYFLQQLKLIKVQDPYRHFIAITDPISNLEKEAVEEGFLETFFGNPNIGGRFSASSVFGVIPLLLMGQDAVSLLNNTVKMTDECAPSMLAKDNKGFLLGAFLAANILHKKDKLKIYLSKSLSSFGLWLEQLLAESLGKNKTGIIPIISSSYDAKEDAVHCFIELMQDETKMPLYTDNDSVIKLVLDDTDDIMAQMFLWEVAVSVVGMVLKINPFDQPDVELSKVLAKKALLHQEKPTPLIVTNNANIYFSQAKNILDFLDNIKAIDYCALLSFLPSSAHKNLLDLANIISQKTSYIIIQTGPRYLHSTGQLFKGGADNSHFIIITGPYEEDKHTKSISFKKAHYAQAVGDFMALSQRGKSVMWIELVQDDYELISQILKTN